MLDNVRFIEKEDDVTWATHFLFQSEKPEVCGPRR